MIAGNGPGGFFRWDVSDKLGADTSFGSFYLSPDGMFPSHIPKSVHTKPQCHAPEPRF